MNNAMDVVRFAKWFVLVCSSEMFVYRETTLPIMKTNIGYDASTGETTDNGPRDMVRTASNNPTVVAIFAENKL